MNRAAEGAKGAPGKAMGPTWHISETANLLEELVGNIILC